MSNAGTDPASSLGPNRGRIASRGRVGRGRGRGKGSFRFPGSKPVDNNDPVTNSLEHPSTTSTSQNQSSEGDAKRKQMRKPDARRGSTTTPAPEPTADISAPRLVAREKELPPHIAGAAVDAESLVSRVRELAIGGHAHTSSMESRFTMSLNWADDEDDPDSLPDLDDWAPKPKSPTPDPTDPPETLQDATLQGSTQVDTQPTPPAPVIAGAPSQPSQSNAVEISISPIAEMSVVTKKPRAGLEASIWASPVPETTIHAASTPPKERRSRQNNSRSSASISRPGDLPFHPSSLSRGFESNGSPHNKTEERVRQPEPTPNPRKPHTRPIISTDAISRLSRTLGRDALRQQQSTTT